MDDVLATDVLVTELIMDASNKLHDIVTTLEDIESKLLTARSIGSSDEATMLICNNTLNTVEKALRINFK